jgi:hypothetical protein
MLLMISILPDLSNRAHETSLNFNTKSRLKEEGGASPLLERERERKHFEIIDHNRLPRFLCLSSCWVEGGRGGSSSYYLLHRNLLLEDNARDKLL